MNAWIYRTLISNYNR